METTIPFNILLLPLLGGFAFVSILNSTKWYAVRASRERLIFYAALAGFGSLALVYIIKIFVSPFFPCGDTLPCVPELWHKHIGFEYSGVSVAALVVAVIAAFLLNLLPWFDRDKQAERIVMKEGGPLEQFLDAALRTEKDVLVTMTNGKVYVGVIVSSFVPDQRDKTITLLPIWSGYRDGSTHKVLFTVDYEDAYKKIEADHPDDYTDQIKDFRITIPIREIRCATFFSRDAHTRYFGGQRLIQFQI